MAMDTATAITTIKTALLANMAATDTVTAMNNLANAIVSAQAALIASAQINVTTGLSGSTGPVTGVIPAGSIS